MGKHIVIICFDIANLFEQNPVVNKITNFSIDKEKNNIKILADAFTDIL